MKKVRTIWKAKVKPLLDKLSEEQQHMKNYHWVKYIDEVKEEFEGVINKRK